MAARIALNSINYDIFNVRANETADKTQDRADIVGLGRTLFYEHARKGQSAIFSALKANDSGLADSVLQAGEYGKVNETFRNDHLLYAARKVCEFTGEKAPETFEQFKQMSGKFYGNQHFYAVLQGIYQEIITPILPAVYSEAVAQFADVVEVGFGETYALSVGSNDIPVFQDSAWGASRSVPANRFYSKDYTLNPQPKTAEIRMKWHQLVGNNMDFGAFFANIVAGMYAKTMGMWSAMLAEAATDPTKVPTALSQTFNAANWVTLANKVSALNNTSISNVVAYGGAVALSKVLPAESTGTSNTAMDAALATLLGRDYILSGYLGKYMGVRLLPLRDAVIPGTQNTTVNTVLNQNTIWMMAANARKPLTIAYNRDTPISIEIDPMKTASFELIFNLTIAVDSAAVFASKAGVITI